jgi:drug/metabolite transporter (DMT)-like permease
LEPDNQLLPKTADEIAANKADAPYSPVLIGIAWMLLSGVLFGLLNTTQKSLTHDLHPPQVLCLRYLAGSVVLLPLLVLHGWAAYRPRRLSLQLLRGIIHTIGSTIWFTALPLVTLAENSAIGFTGPIFMMLGAALFFGERMYPARWVAVLIAFCGVLIVLWPGLREAQLGSATVWLLMASPIFAVSFLISKTLTRTDRPDAIVFWLGLLVGLFSLPVAIHAFHWEPGLGLRAEVVWQWPTLWQWILVLACGFIGSGAHYSMTRAYKIADVSAVQPMRFLDLVWASLFGFIAFSHLPTVWALVGGSIICGATLWITRREAGRLAV